MGRWTVEEIQEWSAQLPLETNNVAGGDLSEDDHDASSNCNDSSDDKYHCTTDKPLPGPPSLNAAHLLPPEPTKPAFFSIPVPVITMESVSQTAPHENVIHRIFDAVRGRRSRSNSRSTVNLDTTPEVVDKHRSGDAPLHKRPHLYGPHFDVLTPVISMSPTASSPRSPGGRRQFSAHTGLRRTKSSRISKANRALDTKRAAARGTLEIVVSTQRTQIQSAHDTARPRVFYPRSSSLGVVAALAAALPSGKPQPVNEVVVESSRFNLDTPSLPPTPRSPRELPRPPIQATQERVAPLPVERGTPQMIELVIPPTRGSSVLASAELPPRPSVRPLPVPQIRT